MNLTKIFHKSRSLIFTPRATWSEIAVENSYRKKVITELLLPMSLIVGVSSILGTVLTDIIEDSFAMGYVFFSGSISFLIFFLEVYLSAWIITELAVSFEPDTDSHSVFTLVIYSHIPFFITLSASLIFPQLIFLNILGTYSFFLFWNGIEHFTGIKADKKTVFMILSSLVMILLYILLAMIFNNIYNTVLIQFTTFSP